LERRDARGRGECGGGWRRGEGQISYKIVARSVRECQLEYKGYCIVIRMGERREGRKIPALKIRGRGTQNLSRILLAGHPSQGSRETPLCARQSGEGKTRKQPRRLALEQLVLLLSRRRTCANRPVDKASVASSANQREERPTLCRKRKR
jgi:hypothetical protein